jgi:hypothetical protein
MPSAGAEERFFGSIFVSQTPIDLPRQAWDKLKENAEAGAVFSAAGGRCFCSGRRPPASSTP